MISLPDYVHIKENKRDRVLQLSVFLQTHELIFDDDEKYRNAVTQLNKLITGPVHLTQGYNQENAQFYEYLLENNLAFELPEQDITTNDTGCSGSEFYNRLYNLVNNQWLLERGETPLAQAMLEPEKHRILLLGWTLEYFHVTRLAVSSLIGFLADPLPAALQQLAQEFVKEELFHERIMAKAFSDTPWQEKQLYASSPLPSTLAYMDFLKDMALRRPHSFFASLFFYEGDDDDLMAFSERIPDTPEFHKIRDSHLSHARINMQGEHADFTRHYFNLIPLLSHQQQQEIVDDMAYLCFLYYDMQDEIFACYQHEDDLEKRLCANQ
ncbi:hypothetical protein [Serratia fonticola]|uniref:hypothetical protein n=1 Tax=Serratia fonticola TaxID=47917 RepID=UPI0003AC6B2F|nr:hypothetical protein [Serratia fonticola]ERK12045.1 hypothetical protein L580_4317 [Serratia fonticola AU-P3(3)]MEB7884106.1 hypothetical protein [Serratia fonticola]